MNQSINQTHIIPHSHRVYFSSSSFISYDPKNQNPKKKTKNQKPKSEHKIHTELDSDLENVELNEIPNNNNNNYNQNTDNNNHNKHNKRHSYTSSTPSTATTDHTQANTYSSNSSLSSADSSCPPRSQSVPPHYPPYAYGYPYPWYMPPPPGEAAPMANWPYPYPYPPPPPPHQHAVEGCPPYPYYYPYPYPPYAQPPSGCEAAPQPPSGYPPFHAMPPPYGPYPYPVAPSYSQSSNEESRASSVLPDIIITPSTDDMPSQVIMQHHIKVEPRESPKRAHSVEIEELVSRPKTRNIGSSSKHEVIDMLGQRLANINKIAGCNTQANLSKQLQKDYAGEQSKELGARSPSENASIGDSESEEESSDDDDEEEDDTPKHAGRAAAPLQSIKSVTNVQVYKGKALDQHLDSESSDGEDDDEDDEDDDCEVSVTISLSNSSRSNSVEKYRAGATTAATYPVEEIVAPLRASKDDISASFSLGMRNKFAGETIANDVTNNISRAKPETEPKVKGIEETVAAPTEEFDFFATLMATKMQAQKMMEQSKNFWKTTAPEAAPSEPQVKAIETPKLRPKENCSEGKPPWPKSAEMSKTQASLEAAKNSFWSTFATASQEQELAAPSEEKTEGIEFWGSIGNKEKAELEDKQWTKKKKTVTYTPLKRETTTRVEHWTTTLRAHVESMPLPQKAELPIVVEEKPKEIEKPKENEENEDFWAAIEVEQSRTDLEKEDQFDSQMDIWSGQQEEQQDGEDADFWADNKAEASSNEEERPSGGFAFDPTKYPEEPREVDTDEEIDFWAEIEAKRQPDDDDDVTFHKSATFWARKERQNSVEETPYKPVEIKAFRAKMPDEPSVVIDVWATLEAARGAEPEIVDPIVEEEKVLVQQYEELPHDTPPVENEERTYVEQPVETEEAVSESNLRMVDTMSLASMHEPATVYTWAAPNEDSYEDAGEPDFWANIEEDRAKKEQVEEADQKRHNYRKAMAFFNTSIDGQQSPPQPSPSPTPTPNRHSVILEAEEPQDVDLGPPGEYEIVGEDGEIVEEHKPQIAEPEEEERGAATPTNFEPQLPELFVEPEPQMKRLANGLPDLEVDKFSEAPKISVRDRISAFEVTPSDQEAHSSKALTIQSLSVDSGHGKGTLSRNSSTQRSESEIEEDDSGVTDMNRQLSETDTESESFPELRKMTSYQRAATHSRLFKLLQDENDLPEAAAQADEFQLKPSRRKIVHNVSITRRQNPNALGEAESMTQRRERLSLPLRKNTSIDADNPSTPNSPASPIMGPSAKNQRVVSDKLVNELVQSLLLKSDSTHLRNLPMERLQAAAKRALVEEMDSAQENSSLDSTPAPTPKQDKEYADYYNSWCDASGSGEEVVPSKAFRALQDPRRSPWTVRCPRVLSSKTINRDLARVTESPEIANGRGASKSPECFRQQSQSQSQSRERSVSSWRRV
ncbi:uncharacterized protein LOC117587988 isoform X1 [Drosophila guanche]|uniref:uncharacterized protein LOC117587988 isoform X1 n=1 Tax=Drosophila guanche TaxID=7266 RepID=UPI00147251B4|nr:uncharacterized protein LOC117587988 isoform X1 [Drosophila guanche]